MCIFSEGSFAIRTIRNSSSSKVLLFSVWSQKIEDKKHFLVSFLFVFFFWFFVFIFIYFSWIYCFNFLSSHRFDSNNVCELFFIDFYLSIALFFLSHSTISVSLNQMVFASMFKSYLFVLCHYLSTNLFVYETIRHKKELIETNDLLSFVDSHYRI